METAIVKKINEIHLQFKDEKDGGRSFIEALAKEFNSYEIIQRNEVIEFFIKELQTNSNDMRNLVLPILEDMDAKETAPLIYETFVKFLKNDDVKWEREIISILFKFGYSEPKEFYSYFIDKCVNDKSDNGYVFFLGVLYCRVDPFKAIDLLANYFCKHLVIPNEKMETFFKNRMGFLVGYFSKNPIDYTSELVNQTAKKNKEVGLRLREIMLCFFHSDQVKDYDEEFIQKQIMALDKIII